MNRDEFVDVLEAKGAAEVFVFVLGINRFSYNYWKNDSCIHKFAEKNYLNFNSETLVPFYSKYNKKTYVDAVSSLVGRLDQEILGFDDDDSFSLESF